MSKYVKKTNPKTKGGRPRKYGKIDLKEVEKLASSGLIDEEISSRLGICRATLNNYKKEEKAFLDTLKRGKDKADGNVVMSLYNKALGGDTAAMIFWLKNRRPMEWRDKQEITQSGNVSITVINNLED